MEYTVSIEKMGHSIPVGRIEGERTENARFSYDAAYLRGDAPAAISLSLPLQEASFSPERTKSYFEGLLPEGFTRRSVAQWMHLDENDYLPILHGLGRECLGALQITGGEEETAAFYEKTVRGAG